MPGRRRILVAAAALFASVASLAISLDHETPPPERPGEAGPAAPSPPLPPLPPAGAAPGAGDEPAPAAVEPAAGEPSGIPWSVRVVDGRTGEEIPGVRVRRLRPLGESAAGPHRVPRGMWCTLTVKVYPPEGYTGRGGSMASVGWFLSPFAEAVSLTVPLWPEVAIRVRVREADGRPLANAIVGRVWLGEAGWGPAKWPPPTGPDGVTVLPGFPGVPGGRVTVAAFAADLRWGRSEPAVLDGSGAGPTVTVVIPEDARRDPPAGPTGDWRPVSRDVGPQPPPEGPPRPVENPASLGILVLLRSGRPAAGAEVVVEVPGSSSWQAVRTGRDGRATVRGLPPGPVRALVRSPGFVCGRGEAATLAAGERRELTIREEEGRTLEVTVLDAEGRPAPSAAVRVDHRGPPFHAQLEDGVQVLRLLTDRDGRCVLRGLPDGEVPVLAVWAGRRARGSAPAGGLLTIRFGEE